MPELIRLHQVRDEVIAAWSCRGTSAGEIDSKNALARTAASRTAVASVIEGLRIQTPVALRTIAKYQR